MRGSGCFRRPGDDLVRRLVELHGGSIEAHSAGLGEGSEFVIRLPALPEATSPAAASVQEPADSPGRSVRVLIVEADLDTAQSLADLVELWGHEVRAAFDGRTALEAATEFQPELVLLNLELPFLDGFEVARRLRQDPKLTKVRLVALAGYGHEDRRRSREAGFDLHLTKPIGCSDLEQLLSRAVEPHPTEQR